MRGNKRVRGWAACSLLLVALVGGCGEPPPIRGRGYEVVFVDQFNYTSHTQMGQVWELSAPFVAPATSQSLSFRTESDGDRYIRLMSGEFRDWEWAYISTAGPRRDTPEPNYPRMESWEGGYFEARLRYSANEWTWPAFWLFGRAKTEHWPTTVCPPYAPLNAEWDILDSGRFDASPWTRDHYHGAVHRNTPAGAANGVWCGVADQQRLYPEAPLDGMDLTQWHVWSGRWIQRWDGTGQMCNYVDGIEIGCQETYDSTNQPMVLNLSVHGNGQVVCTGCVPPPGSPNVWMDVDWVRVSQLS